MRKALYLVVICLLAVSVSGCAVGMALSGKKDVDKAALKIGQPRAEVVAIVGQPLKTTTTETGRTDLFECQRGNAPSGGRAIGHAALDVLTLGLWEVVGTPIEGFSSSKYYISVKYDKAERVTDIKISEEMGALDFN